MVIYIQTQMFHIYMAMGANFDTFPDAWQRFGAVLRLLLPNWNTYFKVKHFFSMFTTH